MVKSFTRIAALIMITATLGSCVVTTAGNRAMSIKRGADDRATDVAHARTGQRLNAEQVLGRNETLLRASLGDPDFMRRDGSAEIWQYKNGTCVLNIFLYDEAPSKSGLKRALHFDARALDGKVVDREACLDAVQR